MIQAASGLSQLQKLGGVIIYVVVSGLLQRCIARRLPQPGYPRLLALLPLALGHASIPLWFDPKSEFLVLGLLFLLQGWLATFKVRGLC